MSTEGVSAGVDGESAAAEVDDAKHIRYEQSRLFSLTLPADDLFGLPAGFLLDPCVDAGYYVHLDPLEPGHHTLHFHGELPGVVTVDVTYQLTVGAGSSERWWQGAVAGKRTVLVCGLVSGSPARVSVSPRVQVGTLQPSTDG